MAAAEDVGYYKTGALEDVEEDRLLSPSYRGKSVVAFAPMPKTKFQLEAERVNKEISNRSLFVDGKYRTSSEEFDYILEVENSPATFIMRMKSFRGTKQYELTLSGVWGSNAYHQAVGAFMWQFETSLAGWTPPPVG